MPLLHVVDAERHQIAGLHSSKKNDEIQPHHPDQGYSVPVF